LKNTISSLLWHETLSAVPARILLTGGGALYKPVQDGLSQCLSAPVEWIDIASSSEIHMDDSLRKTWNGPVMNQALSLTVRPVKKNLGFNFNALELETQARYGQLKSYLKWGAVLGALGIVLLGAEIYLDYQYVRLQLQTLKNEIASEFRKISPETTRVVDPLQQLKTKIAEARNVTLDLSQANSATTVLDILKDISSLIPTSTECLIMSFVYENNVIVMKGQAKNFDAVDTIKKELLKSKLFETITIGPTSLAKQGDKVDFDFRITMKK
jgi:Tfp pilus assembly protein PilN